MLLRRKFARVSQWSGAFLSFLTTVFVPRLLTPHKVAFAAAGLVGKLGPGE